MSLNLSGYTQVQHAGPVWCVSCRVCSRCWPDVCAPQPTGLGRDVWTLMLPSVSVLVSLKGNLRKTEIMECDFCHLKTVLLWRVITSLSSGRWHSPRCFPLLHEFKRFWSFFKTQLPCRASRKPPLGQHHQASAEFPPCFPCCCVFPGDRLPHLLSRILCLWTSIPAPTSAQDYSSYCTGRADFCEQDPLGPMNIFP